MDFPERRGCGFGHGHERASAKKRFCANRRAELVRHLGRAPSYPERLIIERICSIEFWLRSLDVRIDQGDELSGHAIRGRLAADTRLRLDLRELGLAPTPSPPAEIREVLYTIVDPREDAPTI